MNVEQEVAASLGVHRGRRALGALAVFALVAVVLFVAMSGSGEEPAPSAPGVEVVSAPPEPVQKPVRKKARLGPAKKGATKAVTAPSAPVAAEVVPAPEPLPAPVEAVTPPSEAVTPPSEAVPEAVAVVEAPAAVEAEALTPPPPPAPEPEPPSEPEPTQASAAAELLQLDGNGEAIARAIANARRAAVRDCFERELKHQPKLTGTVTVELDLAPPNKLEGVRVTDDLGRPAFTRCVTGAMQQVRFTSLDEEVSVRVPYVLSPERRGGR